MAKLIINGHEARLFEKQFADFHGSSIFTTMRSKGREIALWDRHWQRLIHHADFFAYPLPHEKYIFDLILSELRDTHDQRLRVIISAQGFALTFEDYQPPSPAVYDGVSVIMASMQAHHQLGRFKTGNSLPYSLARKEAEEHGAFEALLCDYRGFVVDGSKTSPLMFDGTSLIALDGGLDGCMREEVLMAAQDLGIATDRRLLKPKELKGELLLANSLIGLVPVGRVQSPVMQRLIERFRMS